MNVNAPYPAVSAELAAGVAGFAEYSAGGVKATGTITFSVNPSAAATVTINGVAFTFVASGASGNQVNIGVDLAATMTALAAKLNASVDPAVSVATYTENGTVLTVTYDTYAAAGNDFTLAASVATPSGAKLTGGVDLIVIDERARDHRITQTQSVAQRYKLKGVDKVREGREIFVILSAKGAGNAVIDLNTANTLTFSTAAHWAWLKFIGGSWRKLAGDATLA